MSKVDKRILVTLLRNSLLNFYFSGQPNWNWNSAKDPNFFEKDGLKKGSWYLVEIEQYFKDQGK